MKTIGALSLPRPASTDEATCPPSRFLRIWLQTLMPPAVTTGLYFLIFGELIGAQLGPIEGLRYVDFIAPGVILMAVITNSYSNVVSSFFSTKYQRYVEELLIAPVPNAVILAGYVTGGGLRGVAVGAVVSLVPLPFTQIHLHSAPVAALTLVLTSALFATAGFINALFAKSFDDISVVPTFVLTPLTYLGGVFYSVSLLPAWAERLSYANPILYMVNSFRYGFLGASDVDITKAFLVTAGAAAVMFAVVVSLMNRGTGIRE